MVEKQNNFRILLVDDEYSWFKEFSESLVEFPDCPVSLEYSASPDDLENKIKRFKADCLFMDLRFDQEGDLCNGLETIRRLAGQLKDIPIVITTGYYLDNARELNRLNQSSEQRVFQYILEKD